MPTIKSMCDAFLKEEFKGIIIDSYITNKSLVHRHQAEKGYTIGYKKRKPDGSFTQKFATLHIVRGKPTLILHLGKKEECLGISTQNEIDCLLGKEYSRIENQKTEKAHEVFIRLDWVHSFETIIPFIDQAHSDRN